MAAQGFLLIATFLLVLMVLARPLGSGLARLINDIPLPGTTGVERVLFSESFVPLKNGCPYCYRAWRL
ncbi:hypothetical protein EIMP300_69870 [Escherichia coli]|uniref:Potassium-transporting ATPase subunit A n=1 Tax=Escherichia coli TaxID=562 RepID=A0A8S0FZL5_ECOLX|nr:hypothetical protein EIMP300_69870 [Escherichia coli]